MPSPILRSPPHPALRPSVLALCLAAQVWPVALHAAPATQAAEPTIAYTVTARDTLIGLNRNLISTPGAWREIARLNHLADPDRLAIGQTLVVPLRLLRSTNVAAQVVSSFGDVHVGEHAIASGALLNVGDTIRTGDASTAVVQLADGSRVKLAPDTEGRLDEHRRFRIKATAATVDDGLVAATLRLISGSVEVLATKVLRAHPLEISTPTAVIGVRGTSYRVRNAVTPATAAASAVDVSATEVLEGKVHAQVGASAAQSADVPARFGAPLEAGKAPQVLPLPPAPDLSALPATIEQLPARLHIAGDTPLRVQVADDAAFDHIVADVHVAAGDDARIAHLADGHWFVRARRISPEGLEGLDGQRAFDMRLKQPPLQVDPVNGAELRAGAVPMRWTPDPTAVRYAVEIARDADFSQPVLLNDDLPAMQFVFHPAGTAFGAADGLYFWRLASVHADGTRGAWGDSQAFVLRPAPRAPMGHLSPDGKTIELLWGGQPEDTVQVELASDADYRSVVAHRDFNGPEGRLPRPAPGTYYAHYRFVEPNGFSTAWSGDVRIVVDSNWMRALRTLFHLQPED